MKGEIQYMKKRTALLVFLILSLCMTNVFAAQPIFNADFSALPDGWSKSVRFAN